MKTLASTTLTGLSQEIKELVRDGVYSLYVLRQPSPHGGVYLLVTGRRGFYVLSATGDVVTVGDATASNDFDVTNAVTFGGPATNSVRVNFG